MTIKKTIMMVFYLTTEASRKSRAGLRFTKVISDYRVLNVLLRLELKSQLLIYIECREG